MAIFDAIFHFMFSATFVVAPLGAIACAILFVGLLRQRGEPS